MIVSTPLFVSELLTLLPTQTISLSKMNHDLRAPSVLTQVFKCIATTPYWPRMEAPPVWLFGLR